MAGGAFVGWLLDKVPSLEKFIKREVRSREVKNIGNAIDSSDDKYINAKLRDIEAKFKKDARASS